MTYQAFLSYKHHTSTGFAEDFELHLKRYARGPFERSSRIFRDEQYLNAGADLPKAIRTALQQSEYLILLASPEAAASPWVLNELEIWCGELGRASKLLVVLTAGTIEVDAENRAVVWERTDALPAYLQEHLPKLPLFIDLSWATTADTRNLDHPRYKVAVNTVVARLRDIEPNLLLGREWRIRRRNLIAAWSTASVLLLLLAAVGFGALELRKRNTELDTALRIAQSRQLAASSRIQAAPDALITAAAAVDRDENNESVRALLDTMSRFHALRRHVLRMPDAIQSLAVTADGSGFLLPAEDGSLRSYTMDGEAVQTYPPPASTAYSRVAILGSGRIVAADEDTLWEVTSGTHIAQFDDFLAALAPGPAPDQAVVALADGRVLLTDLASGTSTPIHKHTGQPTAVVANGDRIVSTALSREHPVLIHDLHSLQSNPLPDPPFSANAASLSPDGKQLAIAFENGQLGAWSLPLLEPLWLERLEYSASAVAYSPDSTRIAFGSNAGRIVVTDTVYGDRHDNWQALDGGLWELHWVGDRLLSAGSDGWVRIWTPDMPGPLATLLPDADVIAWRGEVLYGFHEAGAWIRQADGSISQSIQDFGEVVAAVSDLVVAKDAGHGLIVHRVGAAKSLAFPDPPAAYRLKDMAISDDGRFVASAWWPENVPDGGGRVALWRLQDNTVAWLSDVPDYPDHPAFYEEQLLAVTGSSASLAVWDTTKGQIVHRLVTSTDAPHEALAFIDQHSLLLGSLNGTVELRKLSSLSATAALSEAPVGAIRDLAVLPDCSFITVDVDGVRWFDADFNLRGPLLNTVGPLEDAWEISVSSAGDQMAVHLQTGKTALVSLEMTGWVEAARYRAMTADGSRQE